MITVESVELTLQPWDVMAAREGSGQDALTELLTTVASTNVVERVFRQTPALADFAGDDFAEWLKKWIKRLVERVTEVVKRLGGAMSFTIPLGDGLILTLTF
jgi:hypothetical protein